MKERIVGLRKQLNKSQTVFAEGIGLTQNFLSLVEKGTRNLSDRSIADICRVYGVNEGWLRTGEGEMFAPRDREQEIAAIVNEMLKNDETDFRYQLTKVLYELNEEEIQTLKDIAVKMALAMNNKDAPE